MYLEKIKGPCDVKKLNSEERLALCDEIRKRLISTVSNNGGHLASNLGVVELTVAIHSVFNSPSDSVLFDVGHQSYVHKLLTGREERFDTIRTKDGLSGFMSPSESEHDPYVSGHSSNSISAACGIARANTLMDNNNYTVAVVGDGALTGGMIFEAFNNVCTSKDRLVVVLNDNKMSISRNVGGLSRYLREVRNSPDYFDAKRNIKSKLDRVPVIGSGLEHVISHSKSLVRRMVYANNIFECYGFTYLGPVDGHNIEDVIEILEAAKKVNGPVLVHVCTVKGKGYDLAEKYPESYHGVSHFDVNTGVGAKGDNFSYEFGKELCSLADKDKKLCAITAAMTEGTGLGRFRAKHAKRFFDVGIAEEHAITFASGLASKGMRPVFAVYSSFLQRGYDQIIHDAAIENCNITLAIDRAGLVGEDGVTHQGIFDAAYLNTIPNMKVYSPAFYDELREQLRLAIYNDGLHAVRYSRGTELYKPDWYNQYSDHFVIHGDNKNKIIVTYGRLFSFAAEVAEKTGLSVCKINRISPLPEDLAKELKRYKNIYFFEEGIRDGGIGETLCERLCEVGFKGNFKLTAIDGFVKHSTVLEALKTYNLDKESMEKIVTEASRGR